METPTQTSSEKTRITPQEYLRDRIDDQIQYYERKSALNRRRHYTAKTVVIISGALIPILIGYSTEGRESLKYFAGVLGVIITIVEGIMNLRKYQETWATYRLTIEALRREKLLFQSGVGDYQNEAEAFPNFVFKAEQILSTENSSWSSIFRHNDNDKSTNAEDQKPAA